jgi:hypothetical protein
VKVQVEDPPNLGDNLRVGLAEVGGGDDALRGGAVEMGAGISDEAIGHLLLRQSGVDGGDDRMIRDAWADGLGVDGCE